MRCEQKWGARVQFPSVKKGPRGGAIPSGRCSCDDPAIQSVRDVREFGRTLGTCSYCGDRGLNLMTFGAGRKLHVRCVLRCHGVIALIEIENHQKRVRVCCLSRRTFKRVLWATTDDGHRYGGGAP